MTTKSKIESPSLPTSSQAYGNAISAEIAGLPNQYAAEAEYRPKFTDLEISTLEKYAPRFAQLSRNIAAQEQAFLEQQNPELYAVQEALGKRLSSLDSGLSASQEAAYRSRFAAEQGAAGRLGSPVGSASIAKQLAYLDAQENAQKAQEALQFTSQIPMISGQSITLPSLSSGPSLTGSSVSSQLGLTGSLAGTQAGIYGQQLQSETTRRGQNLNFASNFIPQIKIGL